MVTRFRLEAKGARPPHPGDPVTDREGKTIGMVTSCSIDSEDYQLGQAFLHEDYTDAETPIAVLSGSERSPSRRWC